MRPATTLSSVDLPQPVGPTIDTNSPAATFRDDARPGDIFTIFGRVRDRIVHGGDAALIDQVDDQFHLVHALEIGHFGGITGFDQGFVAGLHEFDQPAA